MTSLVRYLQPLRAAASRIVRLDARSRFVNRVRNRKQTVSYAGIEYVFAVPNWLCGYRAATFATKEPETLAWIDGFQEASVFWDVGANVGLYSIYAAKQKKCQVYSFEPSVFNLEYLARNVSLNGLTSLVRLVPVAVGEKTGVGHLHMTSTEWGGALSTFDKTYGSDGKELVEVFDYATLAVSLDDAVTRLGLPSPHYLKIDVDGIEHLILAGGPNVLRGVRGVLVEISPGFHEQAQRARQCLEEAGLTPAETGFPELPDAVTVNEIWTRG